MGQASSVSKMKTLSESSCIDFPTCICHQHCRHFFPSRLEEIFLRLFLCHQNDGRFDRHPSKEHFELPKTVERTASTLTLRLSKTTATQTSCNPQAFSCLLLSVMPALTECLACHVCFEVIYTLDQ